MSSIIGITGGIGSGKSVVARIARCNGFCVYDCDSEARRLMESDSCLMGALKNLLGEEAYNSDCMLDRRYVASRIFCDNELREEVNAIVHAGVKEDLLRFAGGNGENKIFVESAILFSSGLSGLCDRIWIVTASEEIRIARVKRRNNLTEDEVRKRIKAQSREFENLPEGKIVFLDNGGSVPILGKILNLLYE